ncbi:hypothetical protein ScPMuIL_018580 [Solemya velum]
MSCPPTPYLYLLTHSSSTIRGHQNSSSTMVVDQEKPTSFFRLETCVIVKTRLLSDGPSGVTEDGWFLKIENILQSCCEDLRMDQFLTHLIGYLVIGNMVSV